MEKEFNTSGLCNPDLHYMADNKDKIDKIVKLIEKAYYFTINRPHQYGKTTIQSNILKRLSAMEGWLPLRISFEGIDYEIYQDKKNFIHVFLQKISEALLFQYKNELVDFVNSKTDKIDNFNALSGFIGQLTTLAQKKIVLIIDEVDRSSNNQLFLDFRFEVLLSKF